jgi:hypothetical protein
MMNKHKRSNMGNLITVEVLDENGDPVADKLVEVEVVGTFDGGHLEGYTDESGHVELETEDDYPGHRKINIKVDDQWFGEYYIEGGAFTVNIEGDEGEEYDKELDGEPDEEGGDTT